MSKATRESKGRCPTCSGKGWVYSTAEEGALRRAQRERDGQTIAEVAKTLAVSMQYLSDLERGRRAWNSDIRDRFMRAVHAE